MVTQPDTVFQNVQSNSEEEEENTNEVHEKEGETGSQIENANMLSDDESSSGGSEAYGEKLTENERAAVLARLRLRATSPLSVQLRG